MNIASVLKNSKICIKTSLKFETYFSNHVVVVATMRIKEPCIVNRRVWGRHSKHQDIESEAKRNRDKRILKPSIKNVLVRSEGKTAINGQNYWGLKIKVCLNIGLKFKFLGLKFCSHCKYLCKSCKQKKNLTGSMTFFYVFLCLWPVFVSNYHWKIFFFSINKPDCIQSKMLKNIG